jgi:hypothetical protein
MKPPRVGDGQGLQDPADVLAGSAQIVTRDVYERPGQNKPPLPFLAGPAGQARRSADGPCTCSLSKQFQLTRKTLESARHGCHLFVARRFVIVCLDQLQIIHDDQPDSMLNLESTGNGSDAKEGLHWIVAHEKLCGAKGAASHHNPRAFLLGYRATP